MIAVMPRDSSNGADEANAFLAHVQATYPDTADHWQALDSEEEFEDIVTDEDYMSDGAAPGFSFGIVFSAGSPDWEYKVNGARTCPDAVFFRCRLFFSAALPWRKHPTPWAVVVCAYFCLCQAGAHSARRI